METKNFIKPALDAGSAKRIIAGIGESYRKLLRNSGIPAIEVLVGNRDVLGSCLHNWQFYARALGENIWSLIRALRLSVGTAVTDELSRAILTANSNHYPGIWTDRDIYAMVTSKVHLGFDEEENDWYLSVDLGGDGDRSLRIFFSDYDDEALFQICVAVWNRALDDMLAMASTMADVVVVASDSTTRRSYAMGLRKRLARPLGEWNDHVRNEFDGVDQQGKAFVDLVEGPIFEYMSTLLLRAGFDANAVATVFHESNASVYHRREIKGHGSGPREFVHPWTKLDIILHYSRGGSPYSATITLSPKDLLTLDAATPAEDGGHTTKNIDNVVLRVGRAVQNALAEYVNYTYNVLIAEQNRTSSSMDGG